MDKLTLHALECAWDAPPAVHLVWESPEAVTLVPLSIPLGAWQQDGGPAVGLEQVAEVLEARGVRPLAPGMLGTLQAIAFTFDGWWVDFADNPHDRQRVAKMHGERRLAEHPNAKEVRQVIAVDVTGGDYYVRLVRGAETAEFAFMRPGSPMEPSGIAVEALDRLLTTLAGAQPRTRPEAVLTDNATGEMN